jgi:predicted cupin superfamily sugar epimerase
VTAADLIARLDLTEHPEGGWYREVHRATEILTTPRGPRSTLTSIYYLLEAGQKSRWHVVASDEIWHHHAGAPLELFVYQPAAAGEKNRGTLARRVLGPPADGVEPIAAARAGDWQAARSLGPWSLMACDVGPGFDFEDFRFIASVAGHESHFAGALADLKDLL